MQMPTNHTAHVLDSILCEAVADCIDLESLRDIEQRLAFALGRIEGTTDEQMLAWPRAQIALALRVLADRYASGQWNDDGDLDVRYSNAICRSADPMTAQECGVGATIGPVK